MKNRFLIAIITVVILCAFGCKIYAEDIIINEDFQFDNFESDDYIPPAIKDMLNNVGVENPDEINTNTIFGIIKSHIKASFSKYSSALSVIVFLLILVMIVKRLIRNERLLNSVNFISSVINIVSVFGVFQILLDDLIIVFQSLTDIISLALPSLYAILLSSGCTFSALVSSSSFGIILAFLNNVIVNFISPMVYVLLIIMLFEKISGDLSDTGIFKISKNLVMNTMKFISTTLISVISFQSILGASKDSVSLRAVKFAAVNFIPIVGGVVSESSKTLSAGLKLIRTSVGGTFIFAILLTAFPVIIDILIVKLYFSLFSVFSGLLGSNSEKSLYASAEEILTVLNGSVILSLILSLISIILFITTGFITSY